MPNDNMGTAHGRIRLTYEEKGAAKANAAMAKMQKQMAEMQKRLDKFEKALNDAEDGLERNAKTFDKTSKAAKKYSTEINHSEKSSKKFRQEVDQLIDELERLADALENAEGGQSKLNRSMRDGSRGGGGRAYNAQVQSMRIMALAFKRMEEHFSNMDKNLDKVNNNLGETTRSLRDTERAIRDNSKAARGFSLSIFDMSKGVRAFRKDTRDTIEDLQELYGMFQTGQTYYRNFARVIQLFNTAGEFQFTQRASVLRAMSIAMADLSAETNNVARFFAQAQHNILDFFNVQNRLLGTRSVITLFGSGYTILRNKLLGVGEAIDRSPAWVGMLTRLAGAVGLVSAAGLGIAKILGPFRLVQRIAQGGGIAILTRALGGLVKSLDTVGDTAVRTFGRRAIPAMKLFQRAADDLENRQRRIPIYFRAHSVASIRFANSLRDGASALRNWVESSKGMLTGVALLTSSIGSLWNRFQWFFKLPKPVMAGLAVMISSVLPTALFKLGKALAGASNLLVGLLDGVKQLGGGLSILPGLFATIGAAVTSLIPVFGGLADKFKDLWSDDPLKRFEAFYNLPTHLKPLGQTFMDLKKPIMELQEVLQKSAFRDFEKQVKQAAEVYLPLFRKSALSVTTAFRSAKDRVLEFALAGETQKDFSDLYQNTAISIRNIAEAIKPALNGLKDMGMVGSQYIRLMTGLAPALTQQFEAWANANRENGRMMSWMTDATSGAYDLVKGIKDMASGLWTVLTIFKTNEGDNFLAEFADSMERFNASMKDSAFSGGLANIRNTVATMGANKMEDVRRLWTMFSAAIQRVVPFIEQISNSFSDLFVPALEKSLWVISQFLRVLNETGLDKILGLVLGYFGAFTLLPKVFSTVIDGLKAIGGAILIMWNRAKVVTGLTTAFTFLGAKLATMGRLGGVAGAGMLNIANAAGSAVGLVSSLARAMTVASVAAVALYAIYESGSSSSKAFNNQLRINAESVNDFRDNLNKAFFSDEGIRGSGVMQEINTGLNTTMTNLRNTADKAPGMMDNIYDYFFRMDQRIGSMPIELPIIAQVRALFEESEELNKQQAMADWAKKAANGLNILRDAGVNLQAVITSTDSDFQFFAETQRKLGQEQSAAVSVLQLQREEYQRIEKAFERIGPGGAQLADGIRQIAEAGGDATAKLDGMKKVLQALGILKTDTLQAMADYEQAIDQLAEKVQEFAGFSTEQLIINGQFNLADDSGGGRQLFETMSSLGTQFMALVNTGKNAQEEYTKLDKVFEDLATSTGIPIEQLRKLGEQVGLTPDYVSITAQLVGKDATVQDLWQVFARMQEMVSNGIGVPIELRPGDAEKVKAEIDRLIGEGKVETRDGNLVIKPGLSQADVDKVKTALAGMGIQFPGAMAPPAQAQLPLVPVPGGGSGPDDRSTSDAKDVWEMLTPPEEIYQEGNNRAQEEGSNFVDAYASGISSNPKAYEAIDDMMEEILKRGHSSPPKKGPLSKRGDMVKYQGGKFAEAYATGIAGGTRGATNAAELLMGSAGGALGKGEKIYEAGKFLGQISQLIDFAANAVAAFGQMAETIFGFASFISDPMGKGTFFGSQRKWRRDRSISDEQLKRQQADAAQSRIASMYGSGQRDTSWYDQQTGRRAGPGTGDLVAGASQQEIANYILDKAMSEGYSREQAEKFLIQAVGESHLDPTASNPNGWNGIFQFDASTWKLAGGGDIKSAQQNIDNYFNLARIRMLTPENFRTGEQLGEQVSIGGPWHPDNQALGHLTQAQKDAQKYIQGYQSGAGQATSGIPLGVPADLGNVPSKLVDSGDNQTVPGGQFVAAILSSMFPGITGIGGSDNRPAGTPQMHTHGRALDVGIGDDLDLGDSIYKWVQANAGNWGIQSAIWRNIGTNFVANEGGGPGTTYTSEGHFDHVHIQFADGTTTDIDPSGTSVNVPRNSPYANRSYGLPPLPDQPGDAPKDLFTVGPNGEKIPVTDHLGNNDVEINPKTGKPWTPEEAIEFWNLPENALRYDQSGLMPGDYDVPGLYEGSQEQQLEELKKQTPLLQASLEAIKNPATSDEDFGAALDVLQAEQGRQETLDTPGSRQLASALGSEISSAASDRGFAQEQNPIDQASQIAGTATSIASDIFQVLNSGIEAIGGAKNLSAMMARGVSNTEDIYKAIDEVQKFIQFAADIAGAVSSVTSAIGSVIPSEGTFGAGAAVSAVGQIAGLVQSALETANAMIDLGQEAYRIIGTYVGDFLGYLVGGPGGPLQGNIKFLLDERTNQLLAYSQDNPLDKRVHDYGNPRPNARDQLIGSLNYYAGPGQDPRDSTRQMMFQVKTSQLAVATGQ